MSDAVERALLAEISAMTAPTELDEARHVYERSDDFSRDALDLLGSLTPDDVPPWLLSMVRGWFRGTDRYDTAVDDLMAGDR